MVTIKGLGLIGLPIVAVFTAYVLPTVTILGLRRTVSPVNNGKCVAIKGLEACEDAWIDYERGEAWLVCSSHEARKSWVPAVLHLDSAALPEVSTDYIAILNLNDNTHKRVTLKGLPTEAAGIYVHAIDAVRGPGGKKTIMINSHRPPKNRSLGKTLGANSVVEVFETTGNSHELQYVKTVSHPLLRTPNNLAMTGDRTFFVSNDHRHKVHWSRAFEMAKSVPSDIIYCDASKATVACKVAADGVIYPNGLAKGPRNLLYQGSTLQGLVRIWEEKPDHTLKALTEVPLERPVDNIHVDEDGSIYATTLTKVLDFMAAGHDGGATGISAVEILKISNDTTAGTGKYQSEVVFGDDGHIVSLSTTGAPYRNKLVLTVGTGSGSTGISFASIASRTAGTGTATSSAVIVDSTGGVDSSSLLQYFTKPYIDAHSLSIPSYRYAYILWFVIAGTLILWSIAYHLSGTGTGGSSLGAWFRKWSIRRITWTKRVGGGTGKETGISQEEGRNTQTTRKRVVWASPTFAQTITVLVLIASALCLTFIGDDYIAPTTCTFGGYCGYQSYFGSSGPPKSTYRAKRDISAVQYSPFASTSERTAPFPVPAGFGRQELTRPVKRGPLNPNGWAPFNDPLLASSNKNIDKSAWTTAARLGLISFAMLPLAVTLALKQWPFNIWATPWLTNYHFDKTAILHRWAGRVIWAFSTAHAVAWFYQLSLDKDPFGRPCLIPVWSWYRFTAGAVAWVLLTLITFLSLSPLRNRYYELFYWSHVVLLLLFFAAAIMHHQPVMWFPIVAVAWWGIERFVRFAVFLWINGFARGIWFKEPKQTPKRSSSQSFGMLNAEKLHDYDDVKTSAYPPVPYSESGEPLPSGAMQSRQSSFTAHYPPPVSTYSAHASPAHASPPPGFAAAQLLPGRTIRLTLRTPSTLRWAPGQHLLLNVPKVRFFDSHPYTIASIDHRAKGVAPIGDGSTKALEKGSEVILLVRAQTGFSKALWDHVVKVRRERELRGATASEVAQGVNLRALVSWPMGSAARVEWGAYESLTIIAGGTGITFGVSVLENACTRMARKMPDSKWKTSRVRFIWILKEFSHLSWVATTLRRCMEMCDSSQLQIDLFVTNDTPRRSRRRPSAQPLATFDSTDDLAPPTAPFARQARSGSPSRDSLASEVSDWSEGEDSPSRAHQFNQTSNDYGAHVDSVTDLVLFEGEEEERTAAEVEVSAKLKKEGKLRRALSRRGAKASANPVVAPRHANYSTQRLYESPQPQDSFEALPLDHHDSSPSLHGSPSASRSASFGDMGYGHGYPSMHHDDHSEVQTLGDNSSTRHFLGARSQRDSILDTARDSARPDDQAFFLDVTEAEQQDLEVVAELARPGYPRLDQILDEEVRRSAGKTMVACCGPSSLNTLVRNLVASRIDLKKVAKGDPRGQVSIVVEDFSF
ncbi:hypothetical protein JCM11491_000009 [Sporobolomyces phaffii]